MPEERNAITLKLTEQAKLNVNVVTPFDVYRKLLICASS